MRRILINAFTYIQTLKTKNGYINQLLHCIGFYSRVFVLFLFWRGVSLVKIKTKQIRVNKIQNRYEWIKSKYSAITVLLYTCVTHHDKKQKRIICSFTWQIAKTKNISREMSPFLFNFNFLNKKKIYQKQQKIQKKYFQTNNFQKNVVPAITDICTGGQQCKYQLLGSGINISYYLHGGECFCYCSKQIWRNADITLKFCTHIHLGIMK